MEWENIFADHVTNKGLIFIIFNTPPKSNLKMGRGTEDIFPKMTYSWPTGT